MLIRIAKEEDLSELLDIYNYEVLNGVATFDVNTKTLNERKAWFDEHNIGNHPLIVAEVEGHVAGYASLSGYRDKEAYAATVELSVYIAKPYRRLGLARELTREILKIARARKDIHTVISVITGGNEASISLHKEFGFVHCGTMREVGSKFGKLLDIDNYQLMI